MHMKLLTSRYLDSMSYIVWETTTIRLNILEHASELLHFAETCLKIALYVLHVPLIVWKK